MDIPILFEDGEALVIDKPGGLPIERPRAGGASLEDHLDELKLGFQRPPVPVHRIDTDPSGCLLLAGNPKALKRFDLKKTHFIAISKSGGTAETLMQVLTAADAAEKAGVKSLKKHFTIITEPHQSALADFADGIGAVKLDHPTGVGGRYSVLTMVGALPGLCMGLNFKQLRAGAEAALEQVLNASTPADAPAATTTVYPCQNVLCLSSSRFAIA